MSRLLDIAPDAEKVKEPDNQEFSSYCFEELEPTKVMETISMEIIELNDSSEYLNDSQKSQKPLETIDVKEIGTDQTKTQDFNSEFPKHSQNSWTESVVKTFEMKFDEKPMEK